jgi:hypothetical protein
LWLEERLYIAALAAKGVTPRDTVYYTYTAGRRFEGLWSR